MSSSIIITSHFNFLLTGAIFCNAGRAYGKVLERYFAWALLCLQILATSGRIPCLLTATFLSNPSTAVEAAVQAASLPSLSLSGYIPLRYHSSRIYCGTQHQSITFKAITYRCPTRILGKPKPSQIPHGVCTCDTRRSEKIVAVCKER
ncbi:hypothetical protein BCV70DRAFT_27764 [Testicularia cyperi]|uniref:Uncharacterized protein n=1 Tax=Testicularia cyperi TaxID=1882483 RepID=A0A317XKE7_9BASI|nr:hypothetical protein BCV70DRAFT_27764 [Testicularia cyperi]